MIKVFYGDDRKAALREIEKFLGTKNYETIEGEDLVAEDCPNIFQGATLFGGGERAILMRDALSGAAAEEIAKYASTPHRVALLEGKVDKRGAGWRALAAAKVEAQEFKSKEVDKWAAFEVFRLAKRDGAAAVRKLEELREGLEPKAFIGILASGAFKDFETRAGAKERRVLKELAKLDMELGQVAAANASPDRPWLLIQGFLMRVSKI